MRKVQPLFIKEGNEGFLFTFMITLGISDVKYKTADTITVPAVCDEKEYSRQPQSYIVSSRFRVAFRVACVA